MKVLYLCLFIFSILSSFNSLEEEPSSEIFNIINYYINGTNFPVNLSEIQDDYVYFTFDFESHIEKAAFNDTIFILMNLANSEGTKLDDNSLNYAFNEKNWSIITIEDLKDLNWEKIEIKYKDTKTEFEDNYYLIKATNFEMKSLLLRVSVSNIKGILTGSNVASIPSKSNSSETISRNILLKIFGLLLLLLNIW